MEESKHQKLNRHEVKADIHWLTFEGGKIDWSLDVERGYWCKLSFQESDEEWHVKVFASPGASCFLIRFNESSPDKLMTVGLKFDLKEGHETVAKGVIR